MKKLVEQECPVFKSGSCDPESTPELSLVGSVATLSGGFERSLRFEQPRVGYGLVGIEWQDFSRHDVSMMSAKEKRDRMKLMIGKTLQAVSKSRELIRQTNELLQQCRKASSQFRILRPDNRDDESLPKID